MGEWKALLAHYTQVQSTDPALPVVWVKFSIKANADGILLSWATASEVNSDFFVEKAGTGRTLLLLEK